MTDHREKHLFSADRPISTASEDLLGRGDFADKLASAIKSWKGKDSLVIALYGQWGSGKSSLKNIALESLQKSKDNSPYVVDFNPWQWASHQQLAKAFFKDIGTALGKVDLSEKGKQRAALWRAYGRYLNAGAFLLDGFKKVIFGFLIIIGALGLGGAFFEIQVLLVVIGVIALVFVAIGYFFGEFSEKVASALESESEAEHLSLPDLKDELREMLQTLKIPLLIVIDDVDRLAVDEIKLLFQLLKANADFPNLVYLLLFQRDIVESSLDHVVPKGQEFLEKIVQIGFDIPRIESSRLQKVLFGGLDKLLADQKVGQRFDQKRWGNIYIPGLSPYFKTLRNVHRYLASLSFHIGVFSHGETFEVNPVDLIALEVLRVFDPDVYHSLHGAKSELTKQRTHWSNRHNGETAARQVVESIVNKAPEARREQVREIIKQLFPPAEWIFSGPGYGQGYEERWFRDLRVCHPDVFDKYFFLAIPEKDLSQAELDRILASVSNRENLVAEFRALNERELLDVALDRLEAYKQEIALEHALSFVTALYDIGDEMPHKAPSFVDMGTDMHAARIIFWYMKKETDANRRMLVLKNAMRMTSGIYLPIMTTSLEVRRENRHADYIIEEDALPEFKAICVDKIRHAAETRTLSSHHTLQYLLVTWSQWGSPEEPKRWVERLIETTAGLLTFIRAFLFQVRTQGMGDYVPQIKWRLRLEDIEVFIAIDVMESKVAPIQVEGLSVDDRRAMEAFQKALERRRQGRTGDDWDHDD